LSSVGVADVLGVPVHPAFATEPFHSKAT